VKFNLEDCEEEMAVFCLFVCLFVYFRTFLDCIGYIVSTGGLQTLNWVGHGSGCGLYYDTISAFVWRN